MKFYLALHTLLSGWSRLMRKRKQCVGGFGGDGSKLNAYRFEVP
jgi:hypothetical protein